MTQTRPEAAKVQRRWPLISGGAALAIGAGLGAVLLIRGNTPLEADAEWMEEIVEHRSPVWDVPSYILNYVGTGWLATLISLALIAALFFTRRRYTALYTLIAIAGSLAVVQLLKVAYGRHRPDEILLPLDNGSFPSGHVANAATLMTVLAIVVWRWWVTGAGAAYVVLMALSRTYLGAHWITDTIGGLLIGVGIAAIVWAPLAQRIHGERPSASG
jgi:membrane-associated phospholipid phosphatase